MNTQTHYTRRNRQRVTLAVIMLALVLVAVVLWYKKGGGADRAKPQVSARSTDASAMSGMNAASDGSVLLTAEEIRQFGVTFGTVEMRQLSAEVRSVGSVMVNESRLAKVTPKFAGYVERLYVNFVGQPVRRGQPLAAVFSPDLLAAQQELLVASRLSGRMSGSNIPGVTGSSIDLVAAARQRLRLWDVSDAQINTVLRSGQPIRTVTLYAPASGIVLEKKVVQGQAVTAGEELYTIADLSDVWVDVPLREADAGVVAVGTSAVLDLNSYPGRPFSGRVSYVYPTLGEHTRTVRARITVPNSSRLLKPGMYATVRLNTSAQSALTVPLSAVVQTGERAVVFTDTGSGRLAPRVVTLGRSGSDYVEVLTGLKRGDRVVTSAQFLIDSESNLGEAMSAMSGMGTSPQGKK